MRAMTSANRSSAPRSVVRPLIALRGRAGLVFKASLFITTCSEAPSLKQARLWGKAWAVYSARHFSLDTRSEQVMRRLK
jgi:hypothetical protein